MTAWSHSSLDAFETCPRRFRLTKIDKVVTEPQTEATLHGNEVHKALERHLKNEQGLPPKYQKYLPIVSRCSQVPGKKLIEWKFALTSSYKPTTYFAKDVWCRGVIDYGVVNQNTAVALDWKTGKPKSDCEQLKLFAGAIFAAHPQVTTVKTGFVWLAHDKVDREDFKREDIPEIWGTFLPKVKRLETAVAKNDFPPRPSGLCAKWCPVPRSMCEFSGKG